jgi:hypothetical protein
MNTSSTFAHRVGIPAQPVQNSPTRSLAAFGAQADATEACAEVLGRLRSLLPRAEPAALQRAAGSLLARFKGPELDLTKLTNEEKFVVLHMSPQVWGDLQLQAMVIGGVQITSVIIGPELTIDKNMVVGMMELSGVEHLTVHVADDATRLDLGAWQGTNSQAEQARLANITVGGKPRRPLDIVIPCGVRAKPNDGASEQLLNSKVWKSDERGIADEDSQPIPLRSAHDEHWVPAPHFQFADMPGDDYLEADVDHPDIEPELIFPDVDRTQTRPDELEIASQGPACAMFAADGFGAMLKDVLGPMQPGQSREFCLASEGRSNMRLRLEVQLPQTSGRPPMGWVKVVANDLKFRVWSGVPSTAGQAQWTSHQPEAVVRMYPLGPQGSESPVTGKPAIYMSQTSAASAQALVAALHSGCPALIPDAVAAYGRTTHTTYSDNQALEHLRSTGNPLPPETVAAFVQAVVKIPRAEFDPELKFKLLQALFEGVAPSGEVATAVVQALLHATSAQLSHNLKCDLLEFALHRAGQPPRGEDFSLAARASFDWACACMKEITHSPVLSEDDKASIGRFAMSYGADLPGTMMGILESDAQPDLKLRLLGELTVSADLDASYALLQSMLQSLDTDTEEGESHQAILTPVLRKFDEVKIADALLKGNALVQWKGPANQLSADANLKAERTFMDEEGNTLMLCSATRPIPGVPPARSLSRFASDARPWLYLLSPRDLERRILPRVEFRAARK